MDGKEFPTSFQKTNRKEEVTTTSDNFTICGISQRKNTNNKVTSSFEIGKSIQDQLPLFEDDHSNKTQTEENESPHESSISNLASINMNMNSLLKMKAFHEKYQNLSIQGSPILQNFSVKVDPKDNSKFNTGRWTAEEHQKFIEAMFLFGNEWKRVQQHIKTRSSTQARSHAQKFFIRLRKKFLDEADDGQSREGKIAIQNEKIFNWIKENVNYDTIVKIVKSSGNIFHGKNCDFDYDFDLIGSENNLSNNVNNNCNINSLTRPGLNLFKSELFFLERKDKLCKIILNLISNTSKAKRKIFNRNDSQCFDDLPDFNNENELDIDNDISDNNFDKYKENSKEKDNLIITNHANTIINDKNHYPKPLLTFEDKTYNNDNLHNLNNPNNLNNLNNHNNHNKFDNSINSPYTPITVNTANTPNILNTLNTTINTTSNYLNFCNKNLPNSPFVSHPNTTNSTHLNLNQHKFPTSFPHSEFEENAFNCTNNNCSEFFPLTGSIFNTEEALFEGGNFGEGECGGLKEETLNALDENTTHNSHHFNNTLPTNNFNNAHNNSKSSNTNTNNTNNTNSNYYNPNMNSYISIVTINLGCNNNTNNNTNNNHITTNVIPEGNKELKQIVNNNSNSNNNINNNIQVNTNESFINNSNPSISTNKTPHNKNIINISNNLPIIPNNATPEIKRLLMMEYQKYISNKKNSNNTISNTSHLNIVNGSVKTGITKLNEKEPTFTDREKENANDPFKLSFDDAAHLNQTHDENDICKLNLDLGHFFNPDN